MAKADRSEQQHALAVRVVKELRGARRRREPSAEDDARFLVDRVFKDFPKDAFKLKKQ